ncbi:MAG: hypothetical protein GC186_00290 [Rhodobacteraceae bacterium]|nr:hypothetical protein [Paracoccaceae bacterium]
MTSSTFRRFARQLAGLATVLVLVGCDGFPGSAPTSMATADGAVVVAGPPGFCIDPEASHAGDTGAFVLLGSCASISGALDGQHPDLRAVLTAAVSVGTSGGSIEGSEKQLGAFFRSPEGRRALSRSGKAETVKVLGITHSDGVLILHARDTSAFPGQAVSPDYWRALFDLNGHIVTLSVISVPQAPFTDASGLRALERFVGQVRAASPAPATTPAPLG